MCFRNKFAVSYGLIVLTKSNKVMLIKRKVPYCIQNFYIFLHNKGVKHDPYDHNPFTRLKECFETMCLPYLDEYDQQDYFRFRNEQIYEDMYDFPHGQLSMHKRAKNEVHCFMNAYREFREETGFRFSFTKEDIAKYPLVQVEFNGCDQHKYTQYYFIIQNVKDLHRYRYFDSFTQPFISTVKIKNWKDDRLIYKSCLLSINEAFRMLKQQQNIKTDFKHLLINNAINSIVCWKHKYHNWRCSTCRLNKHVV